jgi:hypothetical protein
VGRRRGCGAPGAVAAVVISEVGRPKVAVLAWGPPAAWKGMLNAVLMDDQRAKNEATFSCQFGYQLAIQTAQKPSNFSPVHSVRTEKPSAPYIERKIQHIGK